MAPNLPPSITVDRNLAYSIRNFVKQNGGKNVSESQMNEILQRVAKFDAERDAGTREGGSIFNGGTTYLGGDASNFQVRQGQQIQLSTAEFNEIFAGILNPIETKSETKPEEKPNLPELSSKPETLAPESDIPDDKHTAPKESKQNISENIMDAVDGKVLEREVNGKKQKISVATVDGEKVRRLINEDGSLGDTLVLISSAGKNKYITQGEMDKKIATVFPEGLPEGVSAEFVKIGGDPVLVFKQDGKILDNAQLKHLAAAQQKDSPAAPAADDKPLQAAAKPENPEETPVENKPKIDGKFMAKALDLYNDSDAFEAFMRETFGDNYDGAAREKCPNGKVAICLKDGTKITLDPKLRDHYAALVSAEGENPTVFENPEVDVASGAGKPSAPDGAKSEVMQIIENLKIGESCQFQKLESGFEFANGAINKVTVATIYTVTKMQDGNIKVVTQDNDEKIYNSNGDILSSASDDTLFNMGGKFGKMRAYDDYQNNVQTLDASKMTLNADNMELFLEKLSSLRDTNILGADNQVLFSSDRADYQYNDDGSSIKQYHFKDKDGNVLSKDDVIKLLTDNKLSSIVQNNAFDLDYVKENDKLDLS